MKRFKLLSLSITTALSIYSTSHAQDLPKIEVDPDCQLLLCFLGGFAPGAGQACVDSLNYMIDRISPPKIQSPIGVCQLSTSYTAYTDPSLYVPMNATFALAVTWTPILCRSLRNNDPYCFVDRPVVYHADKEIRLNNKYQFKEFYEHDNLTWEFTNNGTIHKTTPLNPRIGSSIYVYAQTMDQDGNIIPINNGRFKNGWGAF